MKGGAVLRIGYADPPYPGQSAKHYADHPDYKVAYAWEPVIVKACRKPVVSGRVTMRDWIAQSIALKRGLVGAKPEAVCRWAFEVVGAEPQDELIDMFPGTGAVTDAWDAWRRQVTLNVA